MVTYGLGLSARTSARRYFIARIGAIAVAVGLWFAHGNSASASEVDEIERDAFLKAIAEIETGGNPRAIGSRGERGMYQFTRTTWRMHTRRAFADAHIPSVSSVIAAQHYKWLYDGLIRNGRQPTPYLIAAAWNAGLGRVLSGRVPYTSRDYASRVVNLVSVNKPSIPVAIAIEPAILIVSDR